MLMLIHVDFEAKKHLFQWNEGQTCYRSTLFFKMIGAHGCVLILSGCRLLKYLVVVKWEGGIVVSTLLRAGHVSRVEFQIEFESNSDFGPNYQDGSLVKVRTSAWKFLVNFHGL